VKKKNLREPVSQGEIQAAVDFYGGVTATAYKLDVSESAVRNWLRTGWCPIEVALAIHRDTDGEICVIDLIGIPQWAQQ